jgi:AraC family transcriptional regulator
VCGPNGTTEPQWDNTGMKAGRLGVRLQVDPAGVLVTTARPDPVLVIHFGHPVEVGCVRGGQAHAGTSVHGDIDIVPAGIESRWILKKHDCALVVRVSQDLLAEAAESLELDASAIELRNRFQVRDPKIESLAWALKAEMDDGFKNGQLYTDGIGAAIACQLLTGHSAAAPTGKSAIPGAMSTFRLRRILGYVEEDLNGDLSLRAIAAISGLSISHCQRAFCHATGLSIHQYVIQRRIERAKILLPNKNLSLSEVALSVGFAHQSHLTYHMRRLLGVSPMSLRKFGE